MPAWVQPVWHDVWPSWANTLGTLPDPLALLAATLHLVPLTSWLPAARHRGRRPLLRPALAAAFLAKAIYNFSQTRQLLDRLRVDAGLRQVCGFATTAGLPSESTFSRAFAQFAASGLPEHLHAALIAATQRERLIGHLSRDSTALAVRERYAGAAAHRPLRQSRRPAPKRARQTARKPKRATAAGRGTTIERQRHQTLDQMRKRLPTGCGLGVKKSSKGYLECWRGYKLHLDVADGQIPISALLTGANVHDNQVAIPLMTMSAQRVTWCYDLMDAAYDAKAIHAHSCALGHVPIITPVQFRSAPNSVTTPKKYPRELTWAEQERMKERTSVERVFARLKDEFGLRQIYVRGAVKVRAQVMCAVLALTVDQLLRWAATAAPSTTAAASAT